MTKSDAIRKGSKALAIPVYDVRSSTSKGRPNAHESLLKHVIEEEPTKQSFVSSNSPASVERTRDHNTAQRSLVLLLLFLSL